MTFCYPYHYGPPPTLVRLKSESTPTQLRLMSDCGRRKGGALTVLIRIYRARHKWVVGGQ